MIFDFSLLIYFLKCLLYLRLKLMKVAGLICDDVFSSDVLNFFPNDSYSDDSILRTIFDLAPTIHDTFFYCSLFNSGGPCNTSFSPFITANGLCYTFNGFNLKDLLTDELNDTF